MKRWRGRACLPEEPAHPPGSEPYLWFLLCTTLNQPSVKTRLHEFLVNLIIVQKPPVSNLIYFGLFKYCQFMWYVEVPKTLDSFLKSSVTAFCKSKNSLG